jgi:predicted ATPase
VLGQVDEGLKFLAEAERVIESTEERCSEAELHRVRGDLLTLCGDSKTAEASFQTAVDVARHQEAKLFQLRASARLARLWRDQGRTAEAHNLLAPIYRWFTEGFNAPDLIEAKALLDELEPRAAAAQ